MCTLALLHRVHPSYLWVVAANRDEAMARPSHPPALLRRGPTVIGGQDALAGGTWLGLNQHGLLVAVTNRHPAAVPNKTARSRGLLALDALALPDAPTAAAMTESAATASSPFNLLCADRNHCLVVSWNGSDVYTTALGPGSVALTHGEPNNSSESPRIARALNLMADLASHPPDALTTPLAQMCGSHLPPDQPFCLHSTAHGTVSSTILLVDANLRGTYLFAPGPPCVTPYHDLSPLLTELQSDHQPNE
jgi:hypothetical protein